MSTTVLTFKGEDVAVRLKVVLSMLDYANQVRVFGDVKADQFEREARAELQTIIAELSE